MCLQVSQQSYTRPTPTYSRTELSSHPITEKVLFSFLFPDMFLGTSSFLCTISFIADSHGGVSVHLSVHLRGTVGGVEVAGSGECQVQSQLPWKQHPGQEIKTPPYFTGHIYSLMVIFISGASFLSNSPSSLRDITEDSVAWKREVHRMWQLHKQIIVMWDNEYHVKGICQSVIEKKMLGKHLKEKYFAQKN